MRQPGGGFIRGKGSGMQQVVDPTAVAPLHLTRDQRHGWRGVVVLAWQAGSPPNPPRYSGRSSACPSVVAHRGGIGRGRSEPQSRPLFLSHLWGEWAPCCPCLSSSPVAHIPRTWLHRGGH